MRGNDTLRPGLAPWALLASYDQKTDCKEVEA